jgi:hypothetical protein
MTEIPKNFDEYPKLLEFSTRTDGIGIWEHPDGYTIEVTDGYRDAYYKITPTEVQLLNEVFGFKRDLDFIESLKQLVAADRGEEFRKALVAEFKTQHVWISGF